MVKLFVRTVLDAGIPRRDELPSELAVMAWRGLEKPLDRGFRGNQIRCNRKRICPSVRTAVGIASGAAAGAAFTTAKTRAAGLPKIRT